MKDNAGVWSVACALYSSKGQVSGMGGEAGWGGSAPRKGVGEKNRLLRKQTFQKKSPEESGHQILFNDVTS